MLVITALVLVMVSFLVAGSEVAFFSLTGKDINMLKTKRRPAYRRIVTLLETPKTLLASMLITNNFVNIGIILISNLLMQNWIDALHFHFVIEFLIKVVVVTSLLVLFCEVLPKVWATHHNIWFASSASLIIEILNSIFFRVSSRLVRLSNKIESHCAQRQAFELLVQPTKLQRKRNSALPVMKMDARTAHHLPDPRHRAWQGRQGQSRSKK